MGLMMDSENYNVSSVVVMCNGDEVSRLWDILNLIDNVECHYKDEIGKIVVTIESSSIDEEIKILKHIEGIKGVISAQMIYSYNEKELDELRNNIENSDNVPNILQDDSIKAEDISYFGDVLNNIDTILKK